MSNFNRPPMKQAGFPAQQQPPQAIDNPCAYLPQMRAALYSLMTGNQTQQIRDNDRWRTTHNGNVKELKMEIRKLEIMCDPNMRRRAMRAGPYVPAGSVPPYGPGFGFPFGTGWPW
jgi:hypothetical protein